MDGFRKVYLGLVRKAFVDKWKKHEGGKIAEADDVSGCLSHLGR
jgi:hypothetical protein